MTSIAPSDTERTAYDEAQALALALVVAHPTQPRPFLLDADNAHAGTVSSVAEAICTATAYALTVAPDVLAWDLDNADDAARADALARELTVEGLPVLRASSGRPGHRHLFTVVPDERDRARIAHRAAALGLPSHRTVIRPPGAPHRLGLPVELLDDPAVFTERAIAIRARVERVESTERDRLDWRDLLATGRWPRGWAGEGSDHTMVWWVCIGAIRAGHDLDTVESWLADPANAGGRSYRRRLAFTGKRHAPHWLAAYVWPKAVTEAAKRVTPPADATEARIALAAIAEALAARPWVGKAGATQRAILDALVARGMARGSLTPTMSHRELAEAVPCARRTVARHMPALVVDGWLQVVDRGRGRTVDGVEVAHATRWRLIPRARAVTTGDTPPSTPLSGVTARAPARTLRGASDVLRWGGLGLSAGRVLDALAEGPLTDRGLAEVLSLNRGNLRARLLPRLESRGLAVRVSDGRWSLGENLDEAMTDAAESLGLAGKADKVAARHALDREGYLEHRERTRQRREQVRADALAASMAARRARPLDDSGVPCSVTRTGQKQGTISPNASDNLEQARTLWDGPPPAPPPPQEALEAPLTVAGGFGAH